MGKKNVVWNDYISQKERFADFFNGTMFQGEEIVCPEALTDMDSKLWRRSQEKDSYHEYVRDNVKMWEYMGMRYILSLEPEESPHFALPEDAYDVVAAYSGSQELEIHKEDCGTGEEGFDMCLAIQEMIEDGSLEGMREGREEGRSKGWRDGIRAMNELIHCLVAEGRTEDLLLSSQDAAFQKKLMEEYGICKSGTTLY
ncbi:MAG: hypothetical protein NC293_03330 [Roseburia sp.]|nr:hypothetical protein [Roseburia sp.]